MQKLQPFQAFLYANIPLVKHMQLRLKTIDEGCLMASAPLAPNINDKATVFGGSSAALMTICGWSLIKFNLENWHVNNDVVIHQSKIKWRRAQHDDMTIRAVTRADVSWKQLADSLKDKNRSSKIHILTQIIDQTGEVCTEMEASYVILKNKN